MKAFGLVFPDLWWTRERVIVVKLCRCFVDLRFRWCRVERVPGHPRPPSVEALVYRGCPCWDPPVCHRVQDDSVAERQRSECGWCVCFHLVSACERFCELVLCDGVLHRETKIYLTNCDSRVLWHVGILTHLLDDKRCLASSLSFPTFPLLSSMSHLTWFVGSRRHLWYIRNCFNCLPNSSCSFGMLSAAVVPKTVCSSTHGLCLCGGLLLSSFGSLSAASFAACLNCGFSAFRFYGFPSLQSPWLLQRPGTVELFVVPQAIS